ncbi:MAG: hypothetical protein PVJ09_04255 [Candidatus Woesebacteria bacterium]|jgi:hypothetical protein
MKNTKWFIYLLVIAAIVTIVSVIIRILTPGYKKVPETEFISTNRYGSTSKLSNIIFNGDRSQLAVPAELALAQAQNTETTASYVEEQLTDQFSLTLLEGTDNIWQGSLYSLSKNNQQYVLVSNQEAPIGKTLNKEQAISTASTLLNNFFPNLGLVALEKEISFFKAGFHLEESSEADAEIMEIPFTYKLNGIPVFYAHSEDFPFKVMLNSNYQIQKLTFQPFFVNLTISAKAKSISIDQAIENINQNKASIVFAYYEGHGSLSLEEIASGMLTQVSLEYRIDDELKIAYPFYRFKGTLINNKGDELRAELITPAVQTSAK